MSPPFIELPPTRQTHFNLYCYAAILRLTNQVLSLYSSPEEAFGQFPFLSGYLNELANYGLEGMALDEAEDWWQDALCQWERQIEGHLPLRALRETSGFDHNALILLMTIALVEEDERFGVVFAALQGNPAQQRPTLALLNGWWRKEDERGALRHNLRTLQDTGLLQLINPEAARLDWGFQLPSLLLDILHGEFEPQIAQINADSTPRSPSPPLPVSLSPWLRYRPFISLPVREQLIVDDALQQVLDRLPGLLAQGELQTVIVRGAQQNGRRTLVSVLARTLARGVLEVTGLRQPEDERWRLVGAVATLLPALPVIVFDLAAGETAQLPVLGGYGGPVGVILGKQGGVAGALTERSITLEMIMPDPAARRTHWQSGFAGANVADLDVISERLRMTSGGIRRVAQLAAAQRRLAGREAITLADVRQASRSLNRQVLDTLATAVTTQGDWSQLAVGAETLSELHSLELRCRYREQLAMTAGVALRQQGSVGVRALLSGPSGTGKTLAARLLAAALEMDLYRLDLATVVNKYIGETEKNLSQLFARAEELDVILLLDEGDALLTQRTSVQSSNDRYANLETNYLLQRIESFEGILLVTTNAAERIDSAFQRRMDVVIDFRPPDANERWAIWQLHLPIAHTVDYALLQEAAVRCTLSGGQIRNAALHATLLALNNGGVITNDYLEAAVQREYRKLGAVCPLRWGMGR